MTPEPTGFTWQTLYEHIEGLITGVLNIQQSMKDHPHLKLDKVYTTTFEHELVIWRSYLLLVREMQKRENLDDIRPIMGLNTIRLYCPDQDTAFASITSIPDGRYHLQMKESKMSESLHSFDVDLTHRPDEVEKLVKENCGSGNQPTAG